MIVGNRIDKVEVPHEPGSYIHIRELSGMELDEAQEIRSNTSLKKYASLGKETIEVLRNGGSTNDEELAAARLAAMQADPKLDYDWQYIIDKAVVGWHGPAYDDIEFNDENKKLFDKTTRDWLVEVIILRNVVPEGESQTSAGYLVEG